MNPPEIEQGYRNCLVGISRMASGIADKAESITDNPKAAASMLRASGRLQGVLSKNAEAMLHFFGTTDCHTVSENEDIVKL